MAAALFPFLLTAGEKDCAFEVGRQQVERRSDGELFAHEFGCSTPLTAVFEEDAGHEDEDDDHHEERAHDLDQRESKTPIIHGANAVS